MSDRPKVRVMVDGKDMTERYEEIGRRLRLEGIRNMIAKRFDRCFHPDKPGDGVLFFRRLAREMAE